ncbi:MAG: aroA [Anaerosporomusa subterranea]|nr:aroA [Anaerosporomusa subterranea]
MADVLITPAKLQGNVKVPASKSMGHRAVICAGLAQGTSIVEGATLSDDINVTIRPAALIPLKQVLIVASLVRPYGFSFR